MREPTVTFVVGNAEYVETLDQDRDAFHMLGDGSMRFRNTDGEYFILPPQVEWYISDSGGVHL